MSPSQFVCVATIFMHTTSKLSLYARACAKSISSAGSTDLNNIVGWFIKIIVNNYIKTNSVCQKDE